MLSYSLVCVIRSYNFESGPMDNVVKGAYRYTFLFSYFVSFRILPRTHLCQTFTCWDSNVQMRSCLCNHTAVNEAYKTTEGK